MRFKSRSRALIGSALAASLGLAGLALTASPAVATEDTDVVRVAGTTRYGTAAEAATAAYPDGSANVVLASGEKFPDALAGGGLAGSLDAPIVLSQQNALPAETAAALAELDAEIVTILGGTAAVSAGVETTLEGLGYTVERVGGADRFETAALIAEELGGTTAVLANGLRFPDALAISPGAHALELPLLLTTVDGLHEDAAAYIDGNAVDTVIIVGGTAVVSQATEDALEADGIDVVRLAGATRYESSIEIAEFHVTQGFTLDEVVMATGEKFPDALAGGPYASQLGAPMVLTQTATLTPATAAFLAENCDEIDALSILGGTAAITQAVEDAAAAAAQCDAPATNQTFGVDATSTDLSNLADPTDDPARAYTFTGLTPGGNTSVALFACGYSDDPAPIEVGGVRYPNRNGDSQTTGEVRFANYFETNTAAYQGDTMTGNAVIATVGFTPVGSQEIHDIVAPADGTLLVRLSSTGADCAIPVVWQETAGAGENDLLDLNGRDTWSTPKEPFGIGGAAVWHTGEAPNGHNMEADVLFVDIDGKSWIDVDGNQFFWGRAGDSYYYDGSDVESPMSEALWAAYLSIGDNTSDDQGTPYSRSGNTIFELEGDTPSHPAAVTATTGDFDTPPDGTNDDLRFVVTPPATPEGNIDYYCVDAYLVNADGTRTYTDTECGAETDTLGQDAATTITWLNHGLADGTYQFAAYAVSETNDWGGYSPASAATPIGAPADTAAPIILQATVAAPPGVTPADGGLVGVLDNGDWHRFVFNEVMSPTVAADGSTYRVIDGDGTIVDIVCGGDAAPATDGCFLNPSDGVDPDSGFEYKAGQIMFVRIGAGGATIVPQAAGTTPGAQYPVTITNVSAGWDDLAGNQLNLAGSVDKTIESNA